MLRNADGKMIPSREAALQRGAARDIQARGTAIAARPAGGEV